MANIGFIGAGNMARSIIGGLLNQGTAAKQLYASDLNKASLEALETDFGIHTSSDNGYVAEHCEVIILAVKPQVLAAVCQDLAPSIRKQSLIISIAAGISLGSLNSWLGNDAQIVRCMPNTPALIRQGATGVYARPGLSQSNKDLTQTILESIGCVHWLAEEALIDSVTAVSGSGPAYFFYFLESMIDAAIEQGLPADAARDLAVQTAIGAGQLAQQTEESISELRRKVTSPGGTTEQAILSFEQNQLKRIVGEAMHACAERSRELAKQA